jgi:hypothetical protein
VKIVTEMNENNITRIKAGNILTEAVPITTGIWHSPEIVLSPILFNLVMNEIIKGIKDIEAEYSMENNTI